MAEIGMRETITGYRYQCSCGQHAGLVKGGGSGEGSGFLLVDGEGWSPKLLDAAKAGLDHAALAHGGHATFDIFSWPTTKGRV